MCAGGLHPRHAFSADHEATSKQRCSFGDGHGCALSGEHRGIDGEPLSADNLHVGRNSVSRSEDHQISDHEIAGIDFIPSAVTHDDCPSGQQVLQALSGLLGPRLLNEGERSVDKDYREDGDRELGHAAHERQDAGDPQHEGEEMHQLAGEPAPSRYASGLRELVRTVDGQAFTGLSCGQAPQMGDALRSRRYACPDVRVRVGGQMTALDEETAMLRPRLATHRGRVCLRDGSHRAPRIPLVKGSVVSVPAKTGGSLGPQAGDHHRSIHKWAGEMGSQNGDDSASSRMTAPYPWWVPSPPVSRPSQAVGSAEGPEFP